MHTQGSRLRRWSLLAATVATAAFLLQGCGGGDDGAAGPAGAAGAPGTPGTPGAPGKDLVNVTKVAANSAAATAETAAAWKALAPQVTVTGVTIASAPVVKFSVKDAAGNPVVGLGNKSQSATASVAGLTNIGFTLAKLVPANATTGAPSKWVSYNVLRPPTVAEKAGTVAATTSCDSTTAPTWCGTFPTTDTQGTLVDNGDGSYQYTFYRDPKLVATLAAGLIDTANGLNKKADLGDLSYDATLTHRLGIQLGGNAPGTGSNTPNGVTVTPAVAMVNTANAVYDFRPDGGAKGATREIVKIDTCGGCHDGKVLAHGSRKDPNYCVTCHTDQIRYSFSMEAPATGLTLTGGTTGTTAQKRAETAVVDGRAIGDFPNFIHKLHMGSRLVKQGYNFNANGGAMLFNTVKYPQNVLNCTKCHDGSASAANKTTNGDNWKSVPSRLACGSCHDGINFATGQGTTVTKTTIGHIGGAKANDAQCAICHDATTIPLYHSEKLPSTADAAKRTMSAEISKVVVDVVPASAAATSTAGSTGTGSVTVTFKLTDNGVAVTDATAFSGLNISLAKLNPAANGASSNWQSYTARGRTTVAANPPVVTGYSEDGTKGTLTHTGSGVWTYKFALLNASTAGDIRTIDHVHNASSASITGAYSAATMPTLPNATFPDTSQTTVSYDWWKTHRVGMEFSKGSGSTAVNNKFNAIFDFVPLADAARKAETRNIVSKNTCDTSCHGGVKLHKGYTTEYCVTCHNQNTFDPATGRIDPATGKVTADTVDLQRIVHKLHMGADLPSVLAGGKFTINGAGHDYSTVGFPGVIEKCEICHSATAKKANGTTILENAAAWYTTPTSRACGTCHDSSSATVHINSQISAGVETCTVCHGSTATANVKAVHSK
ncbi:MAG: OmcA/MtrC family decaheme c-type cytochrome [Sterolibacterium sp.]